MDSSKRIRVIGAVLAVIAVVSVGVVVFNNPTSEGLLSERIMKSPTQFENANVALADLPEESQVRAPKGWRLDSDEPVGDASAEEMANEELVHEDVVQDDDIDSPLDFEEDENGEKYVSEIGDDVIVDDDDDDVNSQVVADSPRRCFRGLKKCGFKRVCTQSCGKKCQHKARRICKHRKYCRCYCKFVGNKKLAKKCVIYKKKHCYTGRVFVCTRSCKKYCRKLRRCYCCPRKNLRRSCRRLCRKFAYASKCGRCRCTKIKCFKNCRFVCK